MAILRRSSGKFYIGLSLRQGWILSLCSILLCGRIAKGTPDRGPSYQVNGGVCQFLKECDVDRGEVCWWFYQGCQNGVCVCDPRRYTTSPDGTCLPIRDGNDSCNIDLVCPMGMSCQKGSCKCKLGQMTSDRKFCKHAYHKLLGEECAPFDNTCVQITSSGYTDHEVACDYRLGECTCIEGYKRDGVACRRRNIGESGCTTDYHCQGGAVCSRGKCACPAGYKSVADYTKCAPSNAVSNFHIGQQCDEINERSYCANGLVCHVCGGEQVAKCVKYEKFEERYTGGGGRRVSNSPIMSANSYCIMPLSIVLVLLNGSPMR